VSARSAPLAHVLGCVASLRPGATCTETNRTLDDPAGGVWAGVASAPQDRSGSWNDRCHVLIRLGPGKLCLVAASGKCLVRGRSAPNIPRHVSDSGTEVDRRATVV
jgi:hypothetical protein